MWLEQEMWNTITRQLIYSTDQKGNGLNEWVEDTLCKLNAVCPTCSSSITTSAPRPVLDFNIYWFYRQWLSSTWFDTEYTFVTDQSSYDVLSSKWPIVLWPIVPVTSRPLTNNPMTNRPVTYYCPHTVTLLMNNEATFTSKVRLYSRSTQQLDNQHI